ncbi:MAG: branched-chain amino acid aminotransferase [Candidatus Aminicenantes bacterium]|nr:branched-chain amino acid aminotransferase [Candidatus Aminicenantes bacterium]NIM83878.1 branched-chain amino acid aminotransferase [Candidatus Aminicenantes bacterium]NIN23342.1 branched-chain amino acid aminotransferase [Candidatus Aminicenantes bacterium]NIN47044.1 branched-chain amino acid aminotransferase [Candidatus Aminicenantes bacterium]NIN89968.1 branched-chain amino acid aminotransferase [Candidatus Aminicenantes bacterium]
MEIKRTLLPSEKLKPLYDDALKLKFGVNFTDYMFTMSYNQEQGWHSAEIKPYQPLMLDPAASVFHYGQEVFEGQKAYKSKRDEILLFRPQENAKRFNASSRRLSMPEIPVEDYLYYVDELVKLEERWIPTQKGASLYIRPTGIATEPALGVKASKEYLFFVITCPVGPYYSTGFDPVSLCVCKTYSRAGSGGTGDAKAGGNYGASHIATRDAIAKGYNQVLWLDACERRYVEEVGAMNIFFIIDHQLVTPPLTGTILPGITRKSLLELAPDLEIEPVERLVSIDELVEGIESGRVTEIFGVGTAAIISPVGKINYNEKEYIINNNQTGPWAQKLFDTLTGIQTGEIEDKHGWVHVVK